MFKSKSIPGALLSDHMPFMAKEKNGNITLIGWNMLCQMKFNDQWQYFNNGFNCHQESEEHYKNRLNHITTQIAYAVKKEKPAFICLQECPETVSLRSEFETGLKEKDVLKHYEIKYFNNNADGYYLITLYDAHVYTIVQGLTDEISRSALEEGLAGRILPLVFMHNESKEIILVINVHAKFPKEIKKDVKCLYQRAIELGIKNVAFLGDFNRDLVSQSDNYSKHDISIALDIDGRFADALFVNAVSASSFCSKYNKETKETSQGVETRDGIMSTFPVDVMCMLELNVTNSELIFSKQVSPRLSTTPDGFLEKLELKSNAQISLSYANSL